MRSLPVHTSLNTAHSGCKPSSSMSYCLYPHTLSKSSYSSPYISLLPPPPFYRPIPNHPHSHAPDAQTTPICHVSPYPPHSAHSEDCTNPHCASYPSATPRTSISPLSVPSSPDFADLLDLVFNKLHILYAHTGVRMQRLRICGPTLWNNIDPAIITNSQSWHAFKRQFKKQLLSYYVSNNN